MLNITTQSRFFLAILINEMLRGKELSTSRLLCVAAKSGSDGLNFAHTFDCNSILFRIRLQNFRFCTGISKTRFVAILNRFSCPICIKIDHRVATFQK
jgi:hypothetical protein